MLKYIGNPINGEYIYGIPARDLSSDEVKAYGGKAYLISTGFYQEPKKPADQSIKDQKEG